MTWLGGSRILDSSSAPTSTSSTTGRRSAQRDMPGLIRGARRSGADGRSTLWPATPASTTRSWCCRRHKRQRDRRRLGLLPRGRRCGGRGRRGEPASAAVGDRALARRAARAASRAATPQTPQGRALAPLVAHVRPAARALRGAHRRRRDGPRAAALRDLRRPLSSTASASRRRSGLICLEIFGCREPAARQYAIDLGVALQLTNILRDVPGDLERGRVYIPLEDLRAHGCSRSRPARRVGAAGSGVRSPAVKALLRQQAQRARDYYARAAARAAARATRAAWWPPRSWARSTAASSTASSGATTTCSREVVRIPRPRRAVIAAATWARIAARAGRRRARRVPHVDDARRRRHRRRLRRPARRVPRWPTPARACSCSRRGRSSAAARPRFADRETGELVDNGQHVLFGCYRETFAFLRRDRRRAATCGAQAVAERAVSRSVRAAGRCCECPALPPPLHLLAGVLEWDAAVRGAIGCRSLRMAAVAAARARRALRANADASTVDGELTVSQWLRAARPERAADGVALGAAGRRRAEPVARRGASATPFVRVLAEMFGPDAVGFGARAADPAAARDVRRAGARLHRARGGEVRTGALARVAIDGTTRRRRRRARRAHRRVARDCRPCRGSRCATLFAGAAPPALARLVADAARDGRRKPIVTVNLWYDRQVMDEPFVGLPGRTMQWVFDKRLAFGREASHLSLVASGADALVGESNDELIARAARRGRARRCPARARATLVARHGRPREARDVLARRRPAAAARRRATAVTACSSPATGSTPGCPARSRARW